MKNYTDSDYALNKYSEGIVYRFADKTVVVTLADYLAENPGKTAEDFKALKEFSDADYLNQVRRENASTKKDVPIGDLIETDACAVPSAEYSVVDEPVEVERLEARLNLAKGALDKLTEVQRRRYIQYHGHGLSTRKIAEIEGVEQRTVMDSLEWAEKKIRKFLKN